MSMLGKSLYARNRLDAYWTEPCVVRAFLDRGIVGGDGIVWEPACGKGHIVEELRERDLEVLATDIHDHGYCDIDHLVDFLEVPRVDPAIRCILTNPPFGVRKDKDRAVTAERFVRHALSLMRPVSGMVAMLLRNEFDCAASRLDLFSRPPFREKLVLTRRPRWVETARSKKVSPRHNYAWYVWDWAWSEPSRISYLGFDEGASDGTSLPVVATGRHDEDACAHSPSGSGPRAARP